MAILDSIIMKSKFRGCMLGALIGDCLGAPFEGEAGSKVIVQRFFEKLDGPHFRTPLKQYTDDTAMMKSVAKCLIDKPAIDFKFLAQLFVKEYFSSPRRGYGENVVEVFHKLKGNKFEDVFKPAREQFSGTGSYGNGGAMRIAPVALYFHNDYEAMINAAINVTLLTHTHKLGLHGALLQCIAIQESLHLDPSKKMDCLLYTAKLLDKMKEIENNDDDMIDLQDPTPYQTQLKVIQDLLSSKEVQNSMSEEQVVAKLGNNISALHSVPTAIYCYLRAQKDIPGINTQNEYRRTIQYAISLGGDTDTIATMAGALAGAHFGDERVSDNLQKHCEFVKEMLDIADNLHTVTPEEASST